MVNFDFVGRKKIWFSISLAIILIGVAGLVFRGMNFGIEFKGGTSFDLRFKKATSAQDVRNVLKQHKLGKSVIQSLNKTEVLIKTSSLTKDQQKAVVQSLEEKYGIKEIRYIQSVGPGWGSHVTEAALKALALLLICLLIYISWVFEFKMAVSAIIALIHDILITLGVYALVGRAVTPNTVAALLTILGYSLYDTIVIFHRVQENTSAMQKETYSSMVNRSINQVIIRSINTSLTTLIPVLILLFIGGETLKDFAFALMVGITSGTYSSPFVASQVLALWKEREPKYRNLEAKYGKVKA